MSVYFRFVGRVSAMAFVAATLGCGTDLGIAPNDRADALAPSLDSGSGSNSGPGSGTASGSSSGPSFEDDTVVTSFVVTPNRGGFFRVGKRHLITFEAGAICDPATSSYGPTEWDAPCDTVRRSVTVTARSWYDAAGHPRVVFSPDLRFTPARTVTLYLFDRQAVEDPSFKILYCDAAGACVDEGLTDPSVATRADRNERFLYRRIKHFSGFYVAAD